MELNPPEDLAARQPFEMHDHSAHASNLSPYAPEFTPKPVEVETWKADSEPDPLEVESWSHSKLTAYLAPILCEFNQQTQTAWNDSETNGRLFMSWETSLEIHKDIQISLGPAKQILWVVDQILGREPKDRMCLVYL